MKGWKPMDITINGPFGLDSDEKKLAWPSTYRKS